MVSRFEHLRRLVQQGKSSSARSVVIDLADLEALVERSDWALDEGSSVYDQHLGSLMTEEDSQAELSKSSRSWRNRCKV